MNEPETIDPTLTAPAPETSAASPLTPDSPSSSALAAAFAGLAAGITDSMRAPEPVVDDAPLPDPVDPPAPTEQPRDPVTGQFVEKQEAPVVDPVAPAPAEAATDVGADDDAGGDEIDPALIVEIMPRHAHEQAYRIAVDTPEVAERLRQNLNGAMRREEYETAKAELERRSEQVEQDAVGLIVDPVGTVLDTLTPEQTDLLILALLTDESVYARLGDKLTSIQDDLGRRELRVDVREVYGKARDKAHDQVNEQRALQRNLRQITTSLDAIAPEHLNEAQRALWIKDAQRELSVVCRQHKLKTLDPMAIPTALSARLVATGVDPATAAEQIARAVYGGKSTAPKGAARTAPSPALPSAAPRAGTPAAGSRSVQAVKAAHERRQAAGATAGTGMGTPSASALPSMPANAGLEEAFALVRGLKR